MGHLRPLAAILLLSVAACGDDGGSVVQDAAPVIIDSRPDSAPIDTTPPNNYDLSCYQNTAPTTAPATVTISGTTQDLTLQGPVALAGVTVKACKGDCLDANNLGSVGPTAANGAFATEALTTSGAPVSGYLVATAAGHLTTYLYPHAALDESLVGAPLVLVTPTVVGQLSFVTDAQESDKGLFGVAVTDCGGTPMPVAGATISIKQGGVEVGSDPFDVGALSPSLAGTFLVTNIPVGDVTITATFDGKTFLATTAKSYAGAVTTTQVKPGY